MATLYLPRLIDDIESEQYSVDCSDYDIEDSLNDYIEFYVNDDEYYVLPNPLIKYIGDCIFHVKIVRQHRQYEGNKHTNIIEATIQGEQILWNPL